MNFKGPVNKTLIYIYLEIGVSNQEKDAIKTILSPSPWRVKVKFMLFIWY